MCHMCDTKYDSSGHILSSPMYFGAALLSMTGGLHHMLSHASSLRCKCILQSVEDARKFTHYPFQTLSPDDALCGLETSKRDNFYALIHFDSVKWI
jgi:hypothetical protein